MLIPFALLTVLAAGPDTVLLSTTSGTGRSKLDGQIVDYTGRELRIELASGRTQTVPATHVGSIQTTYTAAQTAADASYEKGALAAALAEYRRALAAEPRAWVRRQIRAAIVECHQALGEELAACREFLTLAAEDPAPGALAAIPLRWSAEPVAADVLSAARPWLARSAEPAALLLGASRLLNTTEHAQAHQALRGVAAGAERALAGLATAQLWRWNATTAAPAELQRWEAAILEMPEPLRAGPYFVLAQGRAHRAQWQAAALAWLRIPIVYPRQRALAAEALQSAGRALEKLDAHDDARRLFQEARQRFGAGR